MEIEQLYALKMGHGYGRKLFEYLCKIAKNEFHLEKINFKYQKDLYNLKKFYTQLGAEKIGEDSIWAYMEYDLANFEMKEETKEFDDIQNQDD